MAPPGVSAHPVGSYQNRGDLVMEALLEGIQSRGQGRSFLTSCEAELQELMKQIDIMVAHKKSEWEGQTQALETCLDIRQQELNSLRNLLDQKHAELGMLHQQVEELNKSKQEMAIEYKQELKKLQEELTRLKKGYEKLQKKQLKESRAVKNHREDPSEMERLNGKIEEFRQKSLEWEKQRVIYQQQVASLEAQRKALAEQSEIIQAQLTNRKQKLESVEISSQSEIHHLTSKLERATDTICANELEIERLNMRVNDLVGTNMTLLKEQQRLEEELRHVEKLLKVLQGEKKELEVTVRSQEDFISGSIIQKEKLQNKLTNIAKNLHSTELIRSLEVSRQEKISSKGQMNLDNVFSQELLQAEVSRLEGSLGSVSETCKQLSQELVEKCGDLKAMEDSNNQYKMEIKKLKEQIIQNEQTYNCALEGMKMEISKLTRELHQRDIAIASVTGSSSEVEHLRSELEKAETKIVDHRDILIQLEALRLENKQLSETLMNMESGPVGRPLPTSPISSIATRFLEEEELRSHHILERLDAHIAELKRESERTVRQFTNLK
ncbi:centrosomal protein of 63 kDa isoform X5 [Antechinus flavipes]|uniref:centrosomal protein of 63 kDa isoform X5 n=1 Tax=Antechinus flavipes TaxID=38775 RepID=UPI0022354E3B|nr:centrosomal protein of 63 kDa isoform X5 [Antechinus flavipes]